MIQSHRYAFTISYPCLEILEIAEDRNQRCTFDWTNFNFESELDEEQLPENETNRWWETNRADGDIQFRWTLRRREGT